MIMDSLLKAEDDKQYVNVFKCAYKFIQMINLIDVNKKIDANQHRYSIIVDSPQQPRNTVDCGAYEFLFAKYMIDNDASTFKLNSNLKRNMMNQLLQLPLNDKKKESPKSTNKFDSSLNLKRKKQNSNCQI